MISCCGSDPKSTSSPICDADVAQDVDALDHLLRPAHDHPTGKIRRKAEVTLAGLAALVAPVGGGIRRLACRLDAGGSVFTHRLIHDCLERDVVVTIEEMGVIDAADLVIRDAATGPAQRAAIPIDALSRGRMIDVIGDIEQVVAFLSGPLEALRG